MTTNESEFLTDRTGNRRYAPVRVTSIDIDAVKRDLLQLWAQGRDLFKRFGIEHREVERLSEVENLRTCVLMRGQIRSASGSTRSRLIWRQKSLFF